MKKKIIFTSYNILSPPFVHLFVLNNLQKKSNNFLLYLLSRHYLINLKSSFYDLYNLKIYNNFSRGSNVYSIRYKNAVFFSINFFIKYL